MGITGAFYQILRENNNAPALIIGEKNYPWSVADCGYNRVRIFSSSNGWVELQEQWGPCNYSRLYIDSGRSILGFSFWPSLTCFVILVHTSNSMVMHINIKASCKRWKYKETAEKTKSAGMTGSHGTKITTSTLHAKKLNQILRTSWSKHSRTYSLWHQLGQTNLEHSLAPQDVFYSMLKKKTSILEKRDLETWFFSWDK